MRGTMVLKAALPILVVGAASCGDTTTPNSRVIGLSFTSQAAPLASPATGAPNFDITVTSGANTLIITKAQVVVRKVKLELSSTAACSDDDVTADDCDELELAPRLVDLPVTDALTTPITTSIPEGTYHEIEFLVHKPGDDAADVAFVAANPNFANASVRVEGTFNGTAFVFTSTLSEKVKLEFNPPVVITATNNNVTVDIDVRTWFKNADGTVINPTTATAGQTNASLVTAKIRASLRAFKDDDKDGKK